MTAEPFAGLDQRVGAALWRWAAERPEADAVVWGERRLNYRDLAAEVAACAKGLLALGVAPGDRVALLSTPRPEFIIVLLAVTEIGAIWVGLHPRYRLAELRYVVGKARPKVIFALPEIEGRRYDEEFAALTAEFGFVETLIAVEGALPGARPYAEFVDRTDRRDATLRERQTTISPDDTAVIIFTSGTTGEPKGAMIRHYGLMLGALVENDRWPSKTGLRLLHNMPINHIAGVGMLGLFPIIVGGTLVFMDRFDPRVMLRTIERERITFWLQGATMFHLAVTHPDFENFDLSSLEYLIWAGAPMPRDLVARLYELPGTLATAFGMTELSLYATYSDLDADFEVLANSIGRPDPRLDLRVADAEGRAVAPGEAGEIQARGRWLMAGYFDNSDATREAFTPDGWFKTGDIAQVRADGNLSIVGRSKEMYISGGYNIYPREIEIAIESHAAVAAAAVLGVSDPVYGEVGQAFLQAEPGTTIVAAEIAAWCRDRLANYKVPKSFEILAELPRLPIGKIDKQALKRILVARGDPA